MEKIFVLDTNVLLYDPEALQHFADNTVIIPVEVIEELDSFKRDMTDRGYNSRKVIQFLDSLRDRGNLGEGVRLDAGGLLRVFAGQCDDYLSSYGLQRSRAVANRVLNLAMHLNTHYADQMTILVSKSMPLRLKADAVGIYAEDYEYLRPGDTAIYSGFRELVAPQELVEQFLREQRVLVDDEALVPNEYILMIGDRDGTRGLGRVHDVGKGEVRALSLPREGVMGIKPLNMGQSCALDALMDDRITMVTLLGKAGTGKTLLAVAAGLLKVVREEQYNRVLVCRPVMPVGRDIGFIPGDIEEKMRPWMQPIYDALEMLRELDRRSRHRILPADLLASDDIGIEPLTYIRGRSIPHQYMIIDESQNLTPLEVKTIITRVGHNTKVVLTGDPHQIDNPYVDTLSNGFSYLVDKFRTNPMAAHVSLTKGERSPLAEMAANLL